MFSKNMEYSTTVGNGSAKADKGGYTLTQNTVATAKFKNYASGYLNNAPLLSLANVKATDLITAHTTNWYSEETSIFVIKVYNTSISTQTVLPLTAKIPINAGPATATSNKAYFDKGYGATISYSLSTTIGGNTIKLAEETGQGDTPDFIIPNLNVNNLYN